MIKQHSLNCKCNTFEPPGKCWMTSDNFCIKWILLEYWCLSLLMNSMLWLTSSRNVIAFPNSITGCLQSLHVRFFAIESFHRRGFDGSSRIQLHLVCFFPLWKTIVNYSVSHRNGTVLSVSRCDTFAFLKMFLITAHCLADPGGSIILVLSFVPSSRHNHS